MFRLVALLSLALLACAAPAAAQTPIHRCIGANGGAVFTDQPCAALKATPIDPAAATADPTPPPVLCATNVDELRQSVIDAFSRHDSIRMAGLILWDGYGRGAAIADIRALTALMKQPLLDVATPGSPDAPDPHVDEDLFAAPSAPATPDRGEQLVLHTASGDLGGGTATWRFDIVRQAGCLWLRNAN